MPAEETCPVWDDVVKVCFCVDGGIEWGSTSLAPSSDWGDEDTEE